MVDLLPCWCRWWKLWIFDILEITDALDRSVAVAGKLHRCGRCCRVGIQPLWREQQSRKPLLLNEGRFQYWQLLSALGVAACSCWSLDISRAPYGPVSIQICYFWIWARSGRTSFSLKTKDSAGIYTAHRNQCLLSSRTTTKADSTMQLGGKVACAAFEELPRGIRMFPFYSSESKTL
jgi:hypothetical protein